MVKSVEAQRIQLMTTDSGELIFFKEEDRQVVSARPCFPWLNREVMISLQNEEGKEVAFVESLKDLDGPSQEALNQAISEQNFAFQVIDILGIDEEFELRLWSVVTEQGPRSFQTPLNAWPTETSDGRILIRDIHKDLYIVNDPTALSAKAEKLLWSFVD